MSLLRRIGLFGVVAGLVVSIVFPVAAVQAQQAPQVRPPLSLTTSPLPLNVTTKPGQTVTADIRVKNNGTQPENLKVELLKFGAEGDTGRPKLVEREVSDLYFNWVSFSETNFRSDPNVWKTIKMTIKTPKEAAFGYYLAVLFTRANPDRPDTGQSGVQGGVASLVLLNVDAPGARREAKVAELVASQKVYEFLPAKLTVKLQNSGNVHVSPAGSLFIKRGNSQVGSMTFNEERGNILPGTNRVFDMTWDDGFPSYKEVKVGSETKRELQWDFGKVQKLRIGKYSATLVAVYDDGQRDVPVEAVVSFWVIPWRILGVLLLILLFIGFGLWGLGRLIWRGIRRQALAPATEQPDESSLAAATKRPKQKPVAKAEAPEDEPDTDAKIPVSEAPSAPPLKEKKDKQPKPVKRTAGAATKKPSKQTARKKSSATEQAASDPQPDADLQPAAPKKKRQTKKVAPIKEKKAETGSSTRSRRQKREPEA